MMLLLGECGASNPGGAETSKGSFWGREEPVGRSWNEKKEKEFCNSLLFFWKHNTSPCVMLLLGGSEASSPLGPETSMGIGCWASLMMLLLWSSGASTPVGPLGGRDPLGVAATRRHEPFGLEVRPPRFFLGILMTWKKGIINTGMTWMFGCTGSTAALTVWNLKAAKGLFLSKRFLKAAREIYQNGNISDGHNFNGKRLRFGTKLLKRQNSISFEINCSWKSRLHA